MKKILLLLFIVCNLSFSQTNYKPAYYITNSGNKVEGFVLYSDLQADKGIYFKTNMKDNDVLISKNDFTELVLGDQKYISKKVEYAANHLTDSSEFIKDDNSPVLKTEQLLLLVLIEGTVSLYVATFDQTTLYFIKTQDSEMLKCLIYYKYKEIDNKANNGYIVNEYNFYKKQLLQYVNCEADANLAKFRTVGYFENDLKKVVSIYNICKSGSNNDMNRNTKKPKLRFAALVGAKMQLVKLTNSYFYGPIKADNYISPSVGLELSYLFPTNSEGAEVFFRVTFDKVEYNSANETRISTGVTTIYEVVDFKSNFLHFAGGPRYYFNGGTKRGLFAQGALEYTILFGDEFGYSTSTSNIQNLANIKTQSYLSINLGVGYLFMKKVAVDVNYAIGSQFLPSGFANFDSQISNFNLNLKYIF